MSSDLQLRKIRFETESVIRKDCPFPYRAVFINPHSYIGLKNLKLQNCLEDLNTHMFVDGIGVQLVMLILGRKTKRITGFDFFLENYDKYHKHLFIGGDFTPDYLRRLKSGCLNKSSKEHEIEIFTPPYVDKFGADTLCDIHQKILSFKPDAIWVCVGAPKQECLMTELILSKQVKLVACVGAVINNLVYPETVPPKILSMSGLEWLHRLFTSFGRTAPRIFVSYPLFLLLILREITGLFNKK